MDEINKLKAIHEKNLAQQEANSRHGDVISSQAKLQNTIVESFKLLVEYLDNRVSKTAVVNQLKEIKTPDALKVVEAVEELHQTIKSSDGDLKAQSSLAEISAVMSQILDEAKKLPKEINIPETKLIDYSAQMTSLEKAVKSVTEAVKAQETTVEAPVVNVAAPIVNVDAPDIKPITKDIERAFKSAVGLISIPEPEKVKPVVDELKKSNKLLSEILEKPVGGGGGGGGRATPYQNSDSIPAFVTLDNGAIPVTSGGIASFQVNDIEEDTTSYFGFTKTDGEWMIKELTDTSVSYATVTNNGAVTSYTDAWTNRAALTYGRFDEAF